MPELSSNAQEILEKRYLNEGEDWEALCRRNGKAIAANERDKSKYSEIFAEEIYNLYFIPGGRILRNCGKVRQSMLNCATLPISDSIEAIGETIKNALILWSYGAGIGIDFSPLREKGRPLVSKGGHSSGMISFLDAIDHVAHTIETGGQRRSGVLAMCKANHPEIFDFINAKLVDGKLSYFNLSVAVDNDFLKAVERDDNWNLEFAGQTVKTIKASDLWNRILEGMITSGEPGLINYNNLIKNNSWYFQSISACNLCCTGDTKIAVADGRNEVSFKQLVEEDKDVPVFCVDNKGKVVIRQMRNPRKTGGKKEVYKVTFDDNSTFRCTSDHKIKLVDGTEISIRDLNIGDRISHITRYQLANKRAKNNTPYWFWSRGSAFQKSEHRIIYEYYNGSIGNNCVIHHKDFNSLNNKYDNLLCLEKNEHNKLHASISTVGEKNGRYLGINPEQYYNLVLKHTSELGRKVTKDEWRLICKKNIYPYGSKYVLNSYKSMSSMFKEASKELGLYLSGGLLREYKRFLDLKNSSDLDIFFDNGIFVRKICENCKKEFIVHWRKRQHCFCSTRCAGTSEKKRESSFKYYRNKQVETKDKQVNIFNKLLEDLGRHPFKKEWEEECKNKNIPYRLVSDKDNKNTNCFRSFKELKEAALSTNFKVVSIEYDGVEDVYNGTVDEFHNYLVVVGDSPTKKKLIISMNCGEIPLPSWGACDLGNLVLPSFISGKTTNWKKLEESINIAVRFLDNVLDVNFYPIKQMEEVTRDSRRIGLGVMGLHDYLISKEIRYGSEKSLIEIERLFKFIRDTAYKASISLSIEKGAFPKYNKSEYCSASFIRKLPAKIRMSIRENGIRNVCIVACPPTGTSSLIANVSSGIEPILAFASLRKDRVSERYYIHDKLREYIKSGNNEKPDWMVDAYDLTPQDHLEVQSTIQKYIDNAASKTINCPKGTTKEELSKYLLEYIYDLKGITVYVDGSKKGQVVNKIPFEEAVEIVKREEDISNDTHAQSCRSGSCEI